MEILVINSFELFPTQPPLSSPLITALLKIHRLNVKQIDMNLEVWEYIFSKTFVKDLKYNIIYSLDAKKLSITELNETEFNEIKVSLCNDIHEVKNIYRTKELFCNIELLNWADSKVRNFQTLFFYNTGYYLSYKYSFSSSDFKLHLSYDKISSFAVDTTRNPLIRIFSDILSTKYNNLNPRLIFIESILPRQIHQLATLNYVLKKIFVRAHICFGGIGFDQVRFARIKESLQKEVKNFLGFDSIFLTRNEPGVVKLAQLGNIDYHTLREIPSLAYHNGKEISMNGPLNEQFSTKTLIPDFADLNLEKYYSPEIVILDKFSNKCYWNKCTFCSINSFKGTSYNLTEKTFTERIQVYLDKYNIKHLFFVDEAASPEQAKVITSIISAQNKNFIWSLRTRIDKKFDKNLLTKMYQSGCRELWIGLESVNENILELMGKADNPSTYKQESSDIIKLCSEIGIGLHFCLLFGFPGETIADHNELIDFFKQHKDQLINIPTFISFNDFFLSPYSYIWKHHEKYHLSLLPSTEDQFIMECVPYENNSLSTNEKELLDKSIKSTISCIKDICCPITHLQELWANSTDSCHELLMKEYFQRKNPFSNELP